MLKTQIKNKMYVCVYKFVFCELTCWLCLFCLQLRHCLIVETKTCFCCTKALSFLAPRHCPFSEPRYWHCHFLTLLYMYTLGEPSSWLLGNRWAATHKHIFERDTLPNGSGHSIKAPLWIHTQLSQHAEAARRFGTMSESFLELWLAQRDPN